MVDLLDSTARNATSHLVALALHKDSTAFQQQSLFSTIAWTGAKHSRFNQCLRYNQRASDNSVLNQRLGLCVSWPRSCSDAATYMRLTLHTVVYMR